MLAWQGGNFPVRRAAATMLVAQMAVASCAPSPVQVVPSGTTYLQRLDAYAEFLGKSVGVGTDEHTTVVQAGVPFAPGTIIIPGRGESGRCILPESAFQHPDPMIIWKSVGRSDREFTVDFDLPVGVLRAFAITDAGISIGSTASLSFEDFTQHTADLAFFERTIASSSCSATLQQAVEQGRPIMVVRGTISAKQLIVFDPNALPAAQTQRVADFDVSLAPDHRATSMTEISPSVHFLVVYSPVLAKRQDESQ